MKDKVCLGEFARTAGPASGRERKLDWRKPGPLLQSAPHPPQTCVTLERRARARLRSGADGFDPSVLVDGLWRLRQAERATLEQRRHISVNARLQILQRDKTPIRQPQTVAIEAGLALGEDGLNFRADA